MQIALVTDTHFGARDDSQVFYKYFQRFYDEVFFPYLKKNGITRIIHLGDIVERRKYINFVTLNVFRNTYMKRCVKEGIEQDILVGNHDIPYRNSNEINAISELFNGIEDHPLIRVHKDPCELDVDGTLIAMLPWIHSKNYDESMEFVRNTKAQILMGHLDIKGFSMYRGVRNEHGLDKSIFNRFELVCSGHFHHRSSDVNIHYLGSPYETTWNDYDDSRGFHIFDTETRSLTFIPNPFRIFYKLWYNDEGKVLEDYSNISYDEYADTYVKVVVQKKTNPYFFDVMLDKLYSVNPAKVTIVDDNHHIDSQSEEEIINEAEDTQTIMLKYIDAVETAVDKNELKKLMVDLFSEAQNVEL